MNIQRHDVLNRIARVDIAELRLDPGDTTSLEPAPPVDDPSGEQFNRNLLAVLANVFMLCVTFWGIVKTDVSNDLEKNRPPHTS